MSSVVRTQVAIVGAGPAGMAAARVLAQEGLDLVMLDEGQRPGGQIFRQLPREFGEIPTQDLPPSHSGGLELVRSLEAELGKKTELRSGVEVFDVQPSRLSVHDPQTGSSFVVEAEKILLATGAFDRSLPFPGWTLPGVITAGAAQVMVHGQLLRPGIRAIVAGTGPLLLPAATTLLAAGVEVLALLEANRARSLLRVLPGILLSGPRRREARHHLRRLRRHRVDLRRGWTVFAAHGDGELSRVVMGKVNARGQPIPGTEQEVAVDLLCVGYGLSPSIELPLRLGCEFHYERLRGGWLPGHDQEMQSTVQGVYVAGEVAGIGGAEVARAEGELAGLGMAAALGNADLRDSARMKRVQGKCRAQRRAADVLLRAFSLLPGLYELAGKETLVCRCEDVSLGEVARASELFGRDVTSVKLGSRAGMGPCQGRICQQLIGELLQHRLGGGPVPCPRVQMPVKPVPVQAVIDCGGPGS